MKPNNNNSTPPKWAQILERRIEARMAREQDPFKTNNFTTRMMYWLMLILSLSALSLIIMQTVINFNLYLFIFIVLGFGIWGTLNYLQWKKKRRVWDGFPASFREYVLKRNIFFQISWHLIFITLIIGFFILIARYIGLEDIFIPHTAPTTKNAELTPEQKATSDAFKRLLAPAKTPSTPTTVPNKSSTPSIP